MAEEDKLEVVASHHFLCRGANFERTSPLRKEDAVPVVVDVYRDGKRVVGCTLYNQANCCAQIDKSDYVDCPFENKPRTA